MLTGMGYTDVPQQSESFVTEMLETVRDMLYATLREYILHSSSLQQLFPPPPGELPHGHAVTARALTVTCLAAAIQSFGIKFPFWPLRLEAVGWCTVLNNAALWMISVDPSLSSS